MVTARIKLYPEASYRKILTEVNPYYYRIFEQSDTMPDDIFKKQLSIPQYSLVVACSGTTVADYHLSLATRYGFQEMGGIVIPKGYDITIVRLLRHCEHDGTPHFNADDQIIFPASDGNVYRLSRNDAPDHYMALSTNAGIKDVASAYNLPDDKFGPIAQYSHKGATLHVELNLLKSGSL
jgi:hypothetical protein